MNVPTLLPVPLNVTPPHHVPRVTWINAAPLVEQLSADLGLRILRGEPAALTKTTGELPVATLTAQELDAISPARLHAAQTGDFAVSGAHRLVDTAPKEAPINLIFSTARRQVWRVQTVPGGPLKLPKEATATQKGSVRLDLKAARANTWLPSALVNAALLHECGDDLTLATELGALLARLKLRSTWGASTPPVHYLRALLGHIQLLSLAQLSGEALPITALQTALRALAFWQGHAAVEDIPQNQRMTAALMPAPDWSDPNVPHFGPLPGTLHLLGHFARHTRSQPPTTATARAQALLRDHALWNGTFQRVPAPLSSDPLSWPACLTPDTHDPELARVSGLLNLSHLRPCDLDWTGHLSLHAGQVTPHIERLHTDDDAYVLRCHNLKVTAQPGHHGEISGLLSPHTASGMNDAEWLIETAPGLLPDHVSGPTRQARVAWARTPQQLRLTRRDAHP